MDDKEIEGGAESFDMRIRQKWDDPADLNLAIVEAVARMNGDDPTELPPLQRSIEVDALRALLSHKPETPVQLSFRYAGVDVTVSSTGALELAVADRERTSTT